MLFKNLFKINLLLKTIICNYLIYIIFNFKCIPHNVGMFPKVVSSTVEDEGIPHNVGMFLRQASDAQMQEGIPHNVGMFL